MLIFPSAVWQCNVVYLADADSEAKRIFSGNEGGQGVEVNPLRTHDVVQMCDIFVRWHGSNWGGGTGGFWGPYSRGLGDAMCAYPLHPTTLVRSVCLLSAHAFGIDFYAVIIFSKRLTMSPGLYGVHSYKSLWGSSIATPQPVCSATMKCRPRVENTLEKI